MQSLSDYLAGQKVSFDLPLDIQATAFQAKVWNYLRTIPEGEVRSYSDVAAQMGNAKSVRAVARACGANRIAIVIPCHRVVRGDGSLGGYRWGLDRKQQLIQRERAKSAAK
jgi:AraC family transcriptional regulator of adaptative response/methylated-DNA-[protein]-cysteine methyltransferase